MWGFFFTCTHPGWSRCAPGWGGLSRGTPFPSAEGSIQDVTLDSSYSFYMIQGLEPGTEHTVTINPIFGDVEGPVVSGKATTGERPAAGAAFSPCGLRGGGTELVSLLSLLCVVGFGDLFDAVGTSMELGNSSLLQWHPALSRC